MNKIYCFQLAYRKLIRHSFYMESKYYNGKLLFLNFLMLQTNITFTEIITGKLLHFQAYDMPSSRS